MRIFCGRVYNTDLEPTTQVSKHFKVKEFKCKATTGNNIVFIDDELVDLLEAIREHFGKPIHINSAYRTPEWNEKVGGAKDSYHMYGMAADIWISGTSNKQLAEYASKHLNEHGGVILYTNFVHVDVRMTKYRKGVI